MSVAKLTYGLDLTTSVTTLLDDLNIIVNHIIFVMYFVLYSDKLLALELHRIGKPCGLSYSGIIVAAVENYWEISVTVCVLCFIPPSLILVFFNDNTQNLAKHCY